MRSRFEVEQNDKEKNPSKVRLFSEVSTKVSLGLIRALILPLHTRAASEPVVSFYAIKVRESHARRRA